MASAVVVGAGIGGLSAAIGLRRAGWHHTGASMAALTRAELHHVLLAALPAGTVRLGVDVTSVPDADLVVAADGIDSRLRAHLWPEVPPPVYNGVTTWLGIAPRPSSGEPPWSNAGGATPSSGSCPRRRVGVLVGRRTRPSERDPRRRARGGHPTLR